MINISITPYLRWKIERLGFHYDPIHDQWYLDYKRNIKLDFDRASGMFLWTVYANRLICWNQTIKEFKKLRRSTVNYYIGDKVRAYNNRISN